MGPGGGGPPAGPSVEAGRAAPPQVAHEATRLPACAPSRGLPQHSGWEPRLLGRLAWPWAGHLPLWVPRLSEERCLDGRSPRPRPSNPQCLHL